jgi:hypothetical protein
MYGFQDLRRMHMGLFSKLIDVQKIDDKISSLEMDKEKLEDRVTQEVKIALEKKFPDKSYEEIAAQYNESVKRIKENVKDAYLNKINSRIYLLKSLKADLA